MIQHVFLVGAKSLGAYGGYETFINKLTEYHQSNLDIKYHVAVKANGQGASLEEIKELGAKAKKRVAEEYTWEKICGQYEDVFVEKRL